MNLNRFLDCLTKRELETLREMIPKALRRREREKLSLLLAKCPSPEAAAKALAEYQQFLKRGK